VTNVFLVGSVGREGFTGRVGFVGLVEIVGWVGVVGLVGRIRFVGIVPTVGIVGVVGRVVSRFADLRGLKLRPPLKSSVRIMPAFHRSGKQIQL
jgi:hypothetical protein